MVNVIHTKTKFEVKIVSEYRDIKLDPPRYDLIITTYEEGQLIGEVILQEYEALEITDHYKDIVKRVKGGQNGL